MIVLVTDPVTNELLTNFKDRPFIIEGTGQNLTKIYFQSTSTQSLYLKHRSAKTPYHQRD